MSQLDWFPQTEVPIFGRVQVVPYGNQHYSPRADDAIFVPTNLTGLKVWLDASTGLYQTVDGTAATADGDPVGEFEDQSGQANHYVQGTASQRGTLKLNIINGRAVMRLDGVDDVLSDSTPVDLGTAHTIHMVVRFNSSLTNQMLLSGALNMVYFGFVTGGGIFYRNATGFVVVSHSFSTNTPYLVSMVRSGTSVDFYVNGAQLGTTQTLAGNDTVSLNNIGGWPGDIFDPDADYGQVLAYDTAHNITQLGYVWAYLNDLFAIY